MVVRTRARYHYGAVTEGTRRPVPSAPHVAHYACDTPPEKARPSPDHESPLMEQGTNVHMNHRLVA
jgi:hypothetical protein